MSTIALPMAHAELSTREGRRATLFAYHCPSRYSPSSEGVNTVRDDDTAIDHAGGIPRWRGIKVVHAPRNGKTRGSKPHNVKREVEILGRIKHENIVKLLEYVYDDRRIEHRLYLPLFVMTLTELFQDSSFPFLYPPPPPSRRKPISVTDTHDERLSSSGEDLVPTILSFQLLSAIAFLHSNEPEPICHRDINPSNVLLDVRGDLKLVDFGTVWMDELPDRNDDGYGNSKGEDGMGYGRGHIKEKSTTRSDGRDGLWDHRAWNEDEEEDWEELRGSMCCDVGTGPYRAPELLFSPTGYDPIPLDLWSAGVIISQFFTPFSTSGINGDDDGYHSDEHDPLEHEESISARSGPGRKGERKPLFESEFGSLGLAASIFKTLGTPTDDNWPTFHQLPDAGKIDFPPAIPIPRRSLLPDLSHTGESAPHVLSIIDGLLRLDPAQRISAKDALKSPWLDRVRDDESRLAMAQYRAMIRPWIDDGLERYAHLANDSRAE
ncbi:hypothetical protein IAR55_004158 [Kwoniella newhampshirensis]|uniref:Protein kinase domain-containing protein n=1 Tax=Kwoniella newhampshirensis TaxID=1651941 RepID=A0AAW0YZ27_9TREE